jgi:hypothetical protein
LASCVVKLTDGWFEVALLVAVVPRLATPEYSSRVQLAGVPPEILTVNEVEATEPLALVDQISVRTADPLFTPARNAQAEPLSVIEPIEDETLPSAHTATIVLLLPLA